MLGFSRAEKSLKKSSKLESGQITLKIDFFQKFVSPYSLYDIEQSWKCTSAKGTESQCWH